MEFWIIWRAVPPEYLTADGSFAPNLHEALAFANEAAAQAAADSLNVSDQGHYVKVVKQLNAGMHQRF